MDSTTLFQKIFGINQHSADVEQRLMKVSAEYPYFIAPYFFNSGTGHSRQSDIISQLFFHSPINFHYAFREDSPNPDYPYLNKNSTPIPSNGEIPNETKVAEIEVSKQVSNLHVTKTETSSSRNLEEEPDDTIKDSETEKFLPVEKQPKAEELLFEPLHTSDYFASQGIKLSEEVSPGDRLGTQLKSFTEWLKTMKRVTGRINNTGIQLDTPFDDQVEKMAEKSNVEEQVITESMAEAYVFQGKKQKALEIYEKLSLLYPAKSAYFAAKIAGLSSGDHLA